MKPKEIREFTVQEITKKLRDSRDAYLQLRLSKQSSEVEKTHRVKEMRRDIARLETILLEKKKMETVVSA